MPSTALRCNSLWKMFCCSWHHLHMLQEPWSLHHGGLELLTKTFEICAYIPCEKICTWKVESTEQAFEVELVNVCSQVVFCLFFITTTVVHKSKQFVCGWVIEKSLFDFDLIKAKDSNVCISRCTSLLVLFKTGLPFQTLSQLPTLTLARKKTHILVRCMLLVSL